MQPGLDVETIKATADLIKVAGPLLAGFVILAMMFLLYLAFDKWISTKVKSADQERDDGLKTAFQGLATEVKHQGELFRDALESVTSDFMKRLEQGDQRLERVAERQAAKDEQYVAILRDLKTSGDAVVQRVSALETIAAEVKKYLEKPNSERT